MIHVTTRLAMLGYAQRLRRGTWLVPWVPIVVALPPVATGRLMCRLFRAERALRHLAGDGPNPAMRWRDR